MKIAITGGTGFVGRALVKRLINAGHDLRCLHRPASDRSGLEPYSGSIEWREGNLDDESATKQLVHGVDAVVHSALWRPGQGFRNAEGDVVEFARVNVLGSIRLMEQARAANVQRFVFVSTCAVHEEILDDRPLDEAHPLWPKTHYGAHKAAIEKFAHSYGLGHGFPVCSIRPTGIYGKQHPVTSSKWYEIVNDIVLGNPVSVDGGGKEVHVSDVAKGIELLLHAPSEAILGQSFACYDQYISRFRVAELAKTISGSESTIVGEPRSPKHQIDTAKIRSLGMEFGGDKLLRETIEALVTAAQSNSK